MQRRRLDEVSGIEVRLVSQTGKAREPELLVGEQLRKLEREISALRDESHIAGRQRIRCQRKTSGRVEDPQTVRAEQYGASGADALDDSTFTVSRPQHPSRRARR